MEQNHEHQINNTGLAMTASMNANAAVVTTLFLLSPERNGDFISSYGSAEECKVDEERLDITGKSIRVPQYDVKCVLVGRLAYGHPYPIDLSTQTLCEEPWHLRIENELAELR
jgi:hypothetical protein